VLAPVRFVPVIVTEVPPAVGPLAGLTAVTNGAAGSVSGVKIPASESGVRASGPAIGVTCVAAAGLAMVSERTIAKRASRTRTNALRVALLARSEDGVEMRV
jgi:hypothetical protein